MVRAVFKLERSMFSPQTVPKNAAIRKQYLDMIRPGRSQSATLNDTYIACKSEKWRSRISKMSGFQENAELTRLRAEVRALQTLVVELCVQFDKLPRYGMRHIDDDPSVAPNGLSFFSTPDPWNFVIFGHTRNR